MGEQRVSPASQILPEEHHSLLWNFTLQQTISLKGRSLFRVPEVPVEGPSCQVWLLETAASFVSPYAVADLGKAALQRKGGGSLSEHGTGHACLLAPSESPRVAPDLGSAGLSESQPSVLYSYHELTNYLSWTSIPQLNKAVKQDLR